MAKDKLELNEPQEIAKGIYWVGKRNQKELEVNVYLRVFEGNGHQINMLIDPGPTVDVDTISDKIEKILGPGFKLHFAFVNHQDPDVAMNAVYFQRHFPNMQIITTEDTWRLIRFFGLNPNRFIAVEKYKSKRISLKTGHKLVFIPTPYCHFRGACAIYDETEEIVFSGDLFGGLSKKPDLFADASYWDGMKTFHQIYMPVNLALKNAVSAIRQVNPKPKMIVPQHGSIITGDLVDDFMDKIENLEVGLDISTNNMLKAESYVNAANEILKNIIYKVNESIHTEVLDAFKSDGSFPEIIIFNKDNKIIGFNITLDDAFQMLIDKLVVGRSSEEKFKIKSVILDMITKWNLPAEHFMFDDDETEEADGLIEDDELSEETTEEKKRVVEQLDPKKLIDYLVEEGGGPSYSKLLGFRMILKVPPPILKQHEVATTEELLAKGMITDPEFAGYLIKAVEGVIGHSVPPEIYES